MKLVVLECFCEEVGFGEHDHVVELEGELGVLLLGEGGVLQALLADALDERVEPELAEGLDLLGHEDGVVRLAALPDVGLGVPAAEDDEVGVGLEQHVEVGQVVLEAALELPQLAPLYVVHARHLREHLLVPTTPQPQPQQQQHAQEVLYHVDISLSNKNTKAQIHDY